MNACGVHIFGRSMQWRQMFILLESAHENFVRECLAYIRLEIWDLFNVHRSFAWMYDSANRNGFCRHMNNEIN